MSKKENMSGGNGDRREEYKPLTESEMDDELDRVDTGQDKD